MKVATAITDTETPIARYNEFNPHIKLALRFRSGLGVRVWVWLRAEG